MVTRIIVHSLHKAHREVVSFCLSEVTLLQDDNEILILDWGFTSSRNLETFLIAEIVLRRRLYAWMLRRVIW
jgi:hypothetical protein